MFIISVIIIIIIITRHALRRAAVLSDIGIWLEVGQL